MAVVGPAAEPGADVDYLYPTGTFDAAVVLATLPDGAPMVESVGHHEMLPAGAGRDHGPAEASRIDRVVTLEHPTGTFDAAVVLATLPDGAPMVESAGIIRTARKLFDGVVFPPR